MATITIDGAEVKDWNSFHSTFQHACGFPDFYGRNMNAWIDCLTYLRDGDGMNRFTLDSEEALDIVITNTVAFAENCPEILTAFVECTALVNCRATEEGQAALLVVTFL